MFRLAELTRLTAATPSGAATAGTLCIYDWSKWRGFLIQSLFPSAPKIAAHWRESPRHLARRVSNDCSMLLLHVDISLPQSFLADVPAVVDLLGRRGIKVINAQVPDIRKRSLQAHCRRFGLPDVTATADGPADELLIVKTDLNAGGYREKRLWPWQRGGLVIPGRGCRLQRRRDYFVAPRKEMPSDVWSEPTIVVERYMSNRDNRFSRVYVAGSAVAVSQAQMEKPIKRMENPTNRTNWFLWRDTQGFRSTPPGTSLSPLPQQLAPRLIEVAQRFLSTYHVDFGAIDMVESQDGEFYVVDINITPHWGDEVQAGFLEHLRCTDLH